MIPQEQEHPHDPIAGVYGDCFRASIASILELPITDVPHFLYDGSQDLWLERFTAFLGPLGYFMMTIPAADWDFKSWKNLCKIKEPIYHLISDESPRFSNELHSVVGCDGNVIHDPHPSKLGLPVKTSKRTFDFIIPLSPAIRSSKCP